MAVHKKTFFKERTIGEIKKNLELKEVAYNLINQIYNLSDKEGLIITTELIPKKYETARKFMKHGPEVKLKRVNSLEEAIIRSKTPVQLRETSFNSIKNNAYCGYSFKPIVGTDKRTRKVSLVECIEGAKLYAYAVNEKNTCIEVKPYDNAEVISKDGAEVIVSVPSRSKKQRKQKFKFSSVPIIDNPKKLGVGFNISSDHDCESKRYNIRYRYDDDKESSRIFNFCAHEIASYFAIVDFYWNENKNLIPMQMNQFAIPTQEIVNFYSKLGNNCLIQTSKDKRPRKMDRAEKEILLWGAVYKKGHDKTFFATEKLRDYKW